MTPATKRRQMQRVYAVINKRGLRVEPMGAGTAVRITGPGVHLTAASIDHVAPADLAPCTWCSEAPEPAGRNHRTAKEVAHGIQHQ